MSALLILIISGILLGSGYKFYGRFLEKKIFNCNILASVPSHTLADGKEFIASKKSVMFGHHFTSIAGTGPIVGPAIGVIWGWLPALLWVIFGSIFLGAVHDFSVLMLSIRNKGQSIAQISEQYLGPQLKYAFFMIICLALWIVIAIFALIMGLIFTQFPTSVIAIWLEIPIAIGMGYWVFKKKGNLILATILSVSGMYVCVYLGQVFPLTLPNWGSMPSSGIWAFILLIYAFVAARIPVNTLLQPRDFLNAWQLYIALALILLGMIAIALQGNPLIMHAPAINPSPIGAPSIWPFLCITIACGAISGFHSLICSGTTSKQINNEIDAKAVGYGSMIGEGFLAVLIIIAVCAGLSLAYTDNEGQTLIGIQAWNTHYGSWQSSSGLGSKLVAVVTGCANFMSGIGISSSFASAIMGVLIASFAGTTLDSATRVQRYMITELCQNSPLKNWITPTKSCGIAVCSAAILAFSSGLNGKGALALWPLFGTVNQLLAALALLLVTMFLKKEKKGYVWVSFLPCVAILAITLWASLANQWQFFKQGSWGLLVINSLILGLAIWLIAKSLEHIFRKTAKGKTAYTHTAKSPKKPSLTHL
ncbi:MAG: carbon starvation protein A [bacterium]